MSIVYPAIDPYDTCQDKKVLACVTSTRMDTIQINNPSAFGEFISFNQMVEMLIHEASHTLGNFIECDATEIQYVAYCLGRGTPELFNHKNFVYKKLCYQQLNEVVQNTVCKAPTPLPASPQTPENSLWPALSPTQAPQSHHISEE